jgi:hypothetical protein
MWNDDFDIAWHEDRRLPSDLNCSGAALSMMLAASRWSRQLMMCSARVMTRPADPAPLIGASFDMH